MCLPLLHFQYALFRSVTTSDISTSYSDQSTPQRQLRLFDIRLRRTEIHEFGWKQESSESQSALINQAWSPDGLYLTSGSADPMFHIFDIRGLEVTGFIMHTLDTFTTYND